MGSISHPVVQAPVETPFDHLTDLIALITDPKAHAKRIAELQAATATHKAVELAANQARKNADDATVSSEVAAVYAGERHDEADKRESELRVKADQLAARESALVANEQALTAARSAWDRSVAETEAADATLNKAIATHHAEATEALSDAQNARDAALALKAEHTSLRDEASAALAKLHAMLAAAGA